jgi:hypothetical protein
MLRIAMMNHGVPWKIKNMPFSDSLTMVVSLSIAKSAEGHFMIGMVASFDKDFTMYE